MGTYTIWKVGEDMVGGMIDITGVVPDEVPAHWLVYFTVADADAALEKVKGGGGDVRTARSTSRSDASRSSPIQSAPSSR